MLQCKNKICQAHPALAPMMESWHAALIASQKACQAYVDHENIYPEVEEASKAAWQIWPKVGRAAPEGWQPKVMTEYNNKEEQLYQARKEAFNGMNDTGQKLTQQMSSNSRCRD